MVAEAYARVNLNLIDTQLLHGATMNKSKTFQPQRSSISFKSFVSDKDFHCQKFNFLFIAATVEPLYKGHSF